MKTAARALSIAAAVVVLGGADALAAPPKAEKSAPAPARIELAIQKATLENGLRVVMNVDHGSPSVAVAVMYDVGTRDEGPSQAGFSQSLARLMFGATKNLGKGEFESLVTGRGGGFVTSSVAETFTIHAMVLPENELALGLWLEAERMKNLDLSGAELGPLRAFHDAFYGPNTAVLVLSGDFDPDTAMSFVHRYFDEVPRIDAKPHTPTKPKDGAAPETKRDKTPAVVAKLERLGWIRDRAVELARVELVLGDARQINRMELSP